MMQCEGGGLGWNMDGLQFENEGLICEKGRI